MNPIILTETTIKEATKNPGDLLKVAIPTLKSFWENLHKMDAVSSSLISLLITGLVTVLLYVLLYYILRPIFRNFERDIALVTLNVSADPILIVCSILTLKFTLGDLAHVKKIPVVEDILTAILIGSVSYCLAQLFTQVFIYYLKEYTKQTEAMWDDVLLPILSAVVPVIIYIFAAGLILKNFGFDLGGIWVALGGATFVLGFALQDILANFFSGIVLLIDTPFRFGDILQLEDGSVGMLKKIGVRVTQVYVFSNHCDVYIPNSELQGHNIVNLSRPTSFYYHSISVKVPPECDLNETKLLLEEIVLAHPDTLGNIDTKLEVIDKYYYNLEEGDDHLQEQQEVGKLRLIAEQEVDFKLEEIEQALEALVVTIQFAEKGGLTSEELENVQQEYEGVLELMGFIVPDEAQANRILFNFEFEENNEEGLVELIRQWYRNWLQDPNLQDDDKYFISDEWERKILLLKKRAQRLYQKIANPKADETRLNDYVTELIEWLKDKLKAPRKKWQEPEIRMVNMDYAEALIYIDMHVSFFVDDIKLEEGKRGERVRSQIYQEIFRHLKNTYLTWNGIIQKEAEEEEGKLVDASKDPNLSNSFVQTAIDPNTAKQGFSFYLSVGKNKSAVNSRNKD
ncbi:MAG TPA: mechanosensitive ion channel domain-containing protein [Leptolyngbyaceae cyanobacterium]